MSKLPEYGVPESLLRHPVTWPGRSPCYPGVQPVFADFMTLHLQENIVRHLCMSLRRTVMAKSKKDAQPDVDQWRSPVVDSRTS